MSGIDRRWRYRIGGALLAWALAWVVTNWWRMRPDVLGLGAVIFATCAVAWFISDTIQLLGDTPFADDSNTRRRPLSHGRLNVLRRLSEDAARRNLAGGAPPGAATFQSALRDLTARRVATRIGHDPTDDELVANVSPDLAAYLGAAEPPVLDPRLQLALIDRIEAL